MINIGDSIFANNKLISVNIPSSVTSIGLRAFNNNRLPDEQAYIYLRRGDGSIDNTHLVGYGGVNKNPIIPDSVITIGESAFELNQLNSVTIPNSVLKVGFAAFWNTNLTSVNIGDNVRIIDYSAFDNNQLTSVTIPSSVKNIGRDAFIYNGPISISSGIPIGSNGWVAGQESCFSISGTSWVKGECGSTAYCYTFSNGTITDYNPSCTKDVVIPATINGVAVTSIGAGSFSGKELTSVYIPNTVTNIGNSAFANNLLNYVALSSNLVSIGDGAFNNNKLKSIYIPNSVTSIGTKAFGNSDLPRGVIGGWQSGKGGCFQNGTPIWSLDMNCFNTQIQCYGFESGTIVSHYTSPKCSTTIPQTINGKSVTEIGPYAFYDLDISSVYIPPTVITIQEKAFRNNKLSSLRISGNVKTIGDEAFSYNNLSYYNLDFDCETPTLPQINATAFLNNGPNKNTTINVGDLTCSVNDWSSCEPQEIDCSGIDFGLEGEPSRGINNLVVITHGWNDDSKSWVKEMQNLTYFDRYQYTAIGTFDWSKGSKVAVPWIAYDNAINYGRCLGMQIEKIQPKFIHLLGHSAGSNVIQNAIKYLDEKKVTIQRGR